MEEESEDRFPRQRTGVGKDSTSSSFQVTNSDTEKNHLLGFIPSNASSAEMDLDDPADWSVDRVIQELCQNELPLCLAGAALMPLINPDTFSKAFRDNDMTGDNLLALEDNDIRTDLGISSFGQRNRLSKIIQHLRSKSVKFGAQQNLPRMTLSAPHDPPQTPMQVDNNSLPYIGFGLPSSFHSAGSASYPIGAISNGQSTQERYSVGAPFVTPFNSTRNFHYGQYYAFPNNSYMQTMASHQARGFQPIKPQTPTMPQPRGFEVDLNQEGSLLDTVGAATEKQLEPMTGPKTKDHTASHDISTSIKSLPRKPKRARIVHLADNLKTWKQMAQPILDISFAAEPSDPDGHAPPEDSEIQDDGRPLKRIKLVRDADSSPPGDASIASKYSGDDEDMTGDDVGFGLLHDEEMDDHLLRRGKHIQTIGVDEAQDPQSPTSRRELSEDSTTTTPSQDQVLQDKLARDLEPRLLRIIEKYPPDDVSNHTFPPYGESDVEDRYTSTEETPPPETNPSKDALTKAEVDAIIDDTFKQYRSSWRARSFAKAQTKAHAKWAKCAGTPALHSYILKECEHYRDHASKQIDILRKGIYQSEWRKPEEVKEQCNNIEASVHNLEEYTLYVDVLKSEQEPPLPPRTVIDRVRKPQERVLMVNGDEDLLSDSDGSFIVDDESEQLPLRSREASVNQVSDGWNPQYSIKSKISTYSQSGIRPPSNGPNDVVVDSIEDIVVTPVQHDPFPVNPRPATGHIGHSILKAEETRTSPSEMQIDPANTHAAVEAAQRNPLLFPDDGVTSDDEDLDRSIGHSSKYGKMGKSRGIPIDLTSSSPRSRSWSGRADSLGVPTPLLSITGPPVLGSRYDVLPPPLPAASYSRYNSIDEGRQTGPSLAWDVRRIQAMTWGEIRPAYDGEDTVPDSRLALAKFVYSLTIRTTCDLLDYTQSFRNNGDDLIEVLQSALVALKDEMDEIADIERKNQRNAWTLTYALICYTTGDEVSVDDIPESHIEVAHALLEDSVPDFRALLTKLLRNHMKFDEDRAIKAVPVLNDEISDSDDLNTDGEVPRGKKGSNQRRPRRTIMPDHVRAQQEDDKRRTIEQERKRRQLLAKKSAQGVDKKLLEDAINGSEPLVYLDPHIAASVKPHQRRGIRFMWREIVENSKPQGCLLAHTMGLGKTMQVIALLATISQCSTSEDPTMRKHIPEFLHNHRIMILCPKALVENWYEEFGKWLPDFMMLGRLIKIDSFIRHPETTIRGWYEQGGVLIIGYEKFRSFVAPSKNPQMEDKTLKQRRLHLTEGPDLVIADEAHKLKNAKSALNQATNQIVTRSRIAMTGSPLNNYLEEYHTMIDWISPDYLGNMAQFKNKYIDPITRGLYMDSTSWERKSCLKKLHVLKRIIAPKVDRADISAIVKELPPKTEFFLTITLTEEQKQAYKIYVEHLRGLEAGSGTKKLNIASVWNWLSVLSLLLNHPSCFIEKLRQRGKGESTVKKQSRGNESDDDGYDSGLAEFDADNLDLTTNPALADAMQKVDEVFQTAKVFLSLDDPSLSNKSQLVKLILEEAVKQGDKTLIFSKSIPTLNYYETMLQDMGLVYSRIDGSKNVGNSDARQKEVTQFNESDTHKVFLISTRAGGLGLNIQSANRVIINDFDFNPTWEEQAVGRAYRIGQNKPVFVYRFLMGGTFEELVHNKAVFKTQLFTRVVDERNVMAQAKQKPGEFLFDPREVEQKSFDDCMGKDPDVLDRVLAKVDCVRNIFLTETFFQDDVEELNEQELKEANAELEMEKLWRENPDEFQRQKQAKTRPTPFAQAQARFLREQYGISTSFPSKKPTKHLSHFVDMQVPLTSGPSLVATNAEAMRSLHGSRFSFGDEFMPNAGHRRMSSQLPRFSDDQSLPNVNPPAMMIDRSSLSNNQLAAQRSFYFVPPYVHPPFEPGISQSSRSVVAGEKDDSHIDMATIAEDVSKDVPNGDGNEISGAVEQTNTTQFIESTALPQSIDGGVGDAMEMDE